MITISVSGLVMIVLAAILAGVVLTIIGLWFWLAHEFNGSNPKGGK